MKIELTLNATGGPIAWAVIDPSAVGSPVTGLAPTLTKAVSAAAEVVRASLKKQAQALNAQAEMWA